MNYLVVQDWPSTHGNHAGMLHMCNMLKSKYPNDYEVVVLKSPFSPFFRNKKGFRKLDDYYRMIYEKVYYPYRVICVCRKMMERLKNEDRVFLLEYLYPETSQLQLAKYIKRHYSRVRVYGLSHLTPGFAEKKYKNYPSMVLEWGRYVDKILTLGSSLSSYFEGCGLSQQKISTGFHYVDSEYYTKNVCSHSNKRLRVIVIGAMARNFQLLADIVAKTPDIDWIICKGRKNVDGIFPIKENIHLLGFMEEDELKYQMSLADVSLSVMDDTIGSNVITTSLSMGLAQVVSDVGSIRDYCNDENAIFCKNDVNDFVNALNSLDKNREKLMDMKVSASRHAVNFRIENVHRWFSSLKD